MRSCIWEGCNYTQKIKPKTVWHVMMESRYSYVPDGHMIREPYGLPWGFFAALQEGKGRLPILDLWRV